MTFQQQLKRSLEQGQSYLPFVYSHEYPAQHNYPELVLRIMFFPRSEVNKLERAEYLCNTTNIQTIFKISKKNQLGSKGKVRDKQIFI